ncbi:MAG: tetratricopeptide repeat protein [Candidatus Rokubacteria bacterium]|nr:tetratricopeptide repeat protein [Candidatus Rokubacteria bacterium]
MTGVIVAAAIIAVPALAFTLWPLLAGRGARGVLPIPPDAREQLLEAKRSAVRALRELEFEHGAGHVSDDDYAELRARYEAEAAAILTELDRLVLVDAAPPPPAPAARPSAWRHPAALGVAGALLLVFGIGIGVGIVRYTEPDPTAGMPQAGTRPLAELMPAPGAGTPPAATADDGGPPRTLPPEVLKGMLDAARQALAGGQYGQAIQAYQAILKRDPQNVDAMTHLGLIVAIGGHADTALETFDKTLAIDPNYGPALLYRGQVLYESKKDVPGAIRAWERFMAVTPAGEDRARVAKLIEDAKKEDAQTRGR